jgi:hypothetical protein
MFGARKSKYGRRAARYRFKNDEYSMVRFMSKKTGKILGSKIFDISETGISFTTSHKLSPRIGELIKMDFSGLSSLQIACVGRVVRIEEPGKKSPWARFPDTVKIGVEFRDLPHTYRRLINESISDAFSAQTGKTFSSRGADEVIHVRGPRPRPSWLVENFGTVFMTFAILACVAVGTYYLMQNLEKQQRPHTQAPWATGFFDKVVPTQPTK